jgi:hypothetical protein
MILNNSINAGSFVYCAAFSSPYETLQLHLRDEGHFAQWSYVVSGEAHRVYTKDPQGTDVVLEMTAKQGDLVDSSDLLHTYVTITTQAEHAAVLNFNPLPSESSICVSILNTGSHHVGETEFDTTLICVSGKVHIGEKMLSTLQFTKIRTAVDVIVPENCIAALVTSTRLRLNPKA